MKVHAVMILWPLILQVAVAAKIKRIDPNVIGHQSSTFTKPKPSAFEEGQEYVLQGTEFKVANTSAWKSMQRINNQNGSCPNGTLKGGDMCIPAGSDRQAYSMRMDWPNGVIPYTFKAFDKSHIPMVEKAMKSWMDNTPVVFEDITGDLVRLQSTHVVITSQFWGCWSYVGKTTFIEQFLNLQHTPWGTCIWHPIIVHEFGHVLGLLHTQSRSDRDAHVEIIEQNIWAPAIHNFDKDNTDNFNTYYSYYSVMHYTRDAFSINEPSATIYAMGHPGDNETLLGPLQFDMGNVDDAAHEDYAIVNRMYNASCHCPFKKPCFNGGYIAKNCSCICRHNYEGNACETKIGKRYEPISKYWNKCGPSHITKDTVIQSFNYPNAHCDWDATCLWYLVPPQQGWRTVIHFTEFHLYPNPWIDHLDVFSENLYTGKRYTGCELHAKTIKSENPDGVMLRWRSGYICGATGFQAKVSFEKILFPCKLWKSVSVLDCERCQMNRRKHRWYCPYFQDCLCDPEPCDDDKKEDGDEDGDDDETEDLER